MNNENIDTTTTEPHNDQSAALTIGQLILKTREEKGLSLKMISQQTKIHIGLLENLEADHLEKLPSKAYVRGFVKSAAKILSLDPEYAVKVLDQTYVSSPGHQKDEKTNVEMKNETARNTLTSMTPTPLEAVKSVTASTSLFLAKAAIVLLIVGVVGVNVKNYYEKSKEETIKLPEVLSTLQKKEPEAKPAPVVDAPKVQETAAEPIKVNIIEDKNVKSDITVNSIKLKQISIAEKQFTEDKSVTDEKMDELLPAKYRVQPTKGVETLFLNASEGDSWLTYKVDDKDIKKFVLRQGRTLFLRGGLIRVFIGNTKSLKAFHNNKPVNLTNDKQTIRNIVLPEEMKSKYMAPLFVFLPSGSVMTSDEYVKMNQEKKNETNATTGAMSPNGAQPPAANTNATKARP